MDRRGTLMAEFFVVFPGVFWDIMSKAKKKKSIAELNRKNNSDGCNDV